MVLPCLTEELFTLQMNHTIALGVPESLGKWPETLGNSFYVDSQWLIPNLVHMVEQRCLETLLTHAHPKEHIEAVHELADLLLRRLNAAD